MSVLLGLQLGYTKHMCFLCLWYSRDDANHYNTTEWPMRTNYIFGRYNVKCQPLIDPSKVYLPPHHIKLGLIKQFVKAMDVNGDGFVAVVIIIAIIYIIGILYKLLYFSS